MGENVFQVYNVDEVLQQNCECHVFWVISKGRLDGPIWAVSEKVKCLRIFFSSHPKQVEISFNP